jgi:hypothetical protein
MSRQMALNQACEEMENLQMMLMGRFCKFQKTKPLKSYASLRQGKQAHAMKIFLDDTLQISGRKL